MAQLSAFLLNSAPTSRNRYQSAAGSLAAFIGAADARYVHSGCHAGQARGAKRGGAPSLTHGIRNHGCTYGKRHKYKCIDAKVHALAGGVAPFCTYEGDCHTLSSHLECMAGTTGLEPATSAVTGFFWRCKARSGTVIEPISNPRPLPLQILPQRMRKTSSGVLQPKFAVIACRSRQFRDQTLSTGNGESRTMA